jgi:hypothetical protein
MKILRHILTRLERKSLGEIEEERKFALSI